MHLKNRGNWRCLKELMLPKKVTTENVLFSVKSKLSNHLSICISSISFISIQHIWHFSNQNGAFFLDEVAFFKSMQHNESEKITKRKIFEGILNASTKRVWPHCTTPKICIFALFWWALKFSYVTFEVIFWNNFADFLCYFS